jgi:ATP-dependent exoDNAse (exonuclease V) alpha subunit
MASGQIERGVELLSEQNRLWSIEHRGERFQAIARAFAESPEGTLVVSPDNKSRRELNAAIRSELRDKDKLGEDVFKLPVPINRQEITGEDRKVTTSYRVGDSVRYTRGSDALGLAAKSYATVIQVDAERNQITVQKEDGAAVTYDSSRVKGVALYSPEQRAFAKGDRVQFTAPWKERSISGRDLGTVTSLDDRGNNSVKLDDSNRTVTWNLTDNKHVDYAYAMTSHSSQGATVNRALIHIDTGDSRVRALIDETLAYVATSRPRYDAQIFTDNADHLAAALSRRHENATALSPEQVSAYSLSV